MTTMTTDPGMFSLIMQEHEAMDARLLETRRLTGPIRNLVVLSAAGLAAHGFAVGLVAQLVGAHNTLHLGFFLAGSPALWLPIAFVCAFLGAMMICLPSFYFYTQLSGLDAPFRVITAQALRMQARTSILLMGILPFYVAIGLAAIVGFVQDLDTLLLLGLMLPFVMGVLNIKPLHNAFKRLVTLLPITHERRGDFLGRLVLGWCCVFTAVCPVALYRVGTSLSAVI